jgi:peptide deformylase
MAPRERGEAGPGMIETFAYYGNPVLREKARPVTVFDGELQRFAAAMLDVMREREGIGLAAQQVGSTLSICVVDVPARLDLDEQGTPLNPGVELPLILVNPRIERSGTELAVREEGCLSFPEITAQVTRPFEIDLVYEDLSGVTRSLGLRGLVARAVQHEMDHLAGVLLVDRMTPVRKLALSGRLKRLSRETRQTLRSGTA